MSAPKAEAAGLTVERREELRRVAEAESRMVRCNNCEHEGEFQCPACGVLTPALFEGENRRLLDAFKREHKWRREVEAERDEARAAVERVRALVESWERDQILLPSGATQHEVICAVIDRLERAIETIRSGA